eukprot:88488_1
MSQSQKTEQKSMVTDIITKTVEKHSTISNAVTDLKQQLPFMSDDAVYNMIVDLLKHNKHLKLLDDYRNNSNDIDINEETERLLSSFDQNDLTDLQQTLHEINKNDNPSTTIDFTMDWTKICQCVTHEMWPKLASIIKSLIHKNQISICKINQKNIKTIIDGLKSRNTEIEPLQYLKQLIKRALQFQKATKLQEYDISQLKRRSENTIIQSRLMDIYCIHKLFIFARFNFENYGIKDFREDIIMNGKSILGEKKIKKILQNIKVVREPNLFP